jgi:UDPglucose 6-dehydrogenase
MDISASHSPVLRMSLESAELSKYACNAFLAVKVSYVNALAELCGKIGADVNAVTEVMGTDSRIGAKFLSPGPGWGGSCLPKDTAEFVATGERYGVELAEVRAARDTNFWQPERIIRALRRLPFRLCVSRVAVLGLAFKAGTNDVRDSPAVELCRILRQEGVTMSAYDPVARLDPRDEGLVQVVDSPILAVKDADAILILTDWDEFECLDWDEIAEAAPGAIIIDPRNMLDPDELPGLGYLGNGTGRTSY